MFGGRIGDQEVGEVQCETLAERSRESRSVFDGCL